jgi:spermidine synthase
MEWFVERHNGTGFIVKGEKILEKEGLQKIEVFSTSLGKMLVLDGKIQFSEADEKFYHEMLVHIPLLLHPEPRKILVIGGGDGGAAREALKHEPDKIKIVEIDRDVVEICKKYIGIDDGALEDDRVEIIFQDGIEFIKNCEEKFDVIIVDGSDPDAVSKPLISKEFYSRCAGICDIFVTQSQSPFMQQQYFEAILQNSSAFSWRKIYLSFMPTYPSGMWSFLIASGKELEIDGELIKSRYEKRKIKTYHYNPDLHAASFALPNWVREIVGNYGIK